MTGNGSTRAREEGVERARAFSPFLRDAMARRPDVLEAFLDRGAGAAAEIARNLRADAIGAELRRRRIGVALAAALGDLSGEFGLEQVTAILSDFADQAIESAVEAAIAERMPEEQPRGFAVIALGKLGSRELNFPLTLICCCCSILRRSHGGRGRILENPRSGSGGGLSSSSRSEPRTGTSRGSI